VIVLPAPMAPDPSLDRVARALTPPGAGHREDAMSRWTPTVPVLVGGSADRFGAARALPLLSSPAPSAR